MIRKACRRYNVPGDSHFLTFSCYRRLPLLSRDRTRGWLIEAIEAARRREGFDLWGYVVMPEHVHLLIHPRETGYDISRILWRIKRPVGRKAIHFLGRTAPAWLHRELTVIRPDGSRGRFFWQAGGGHDRNVVDENAISAKLDYIHQNPVRRGLVARAEDWPRSSAGWYAGSASQLLVPDPTLPRVYEV